VKTTVTIRSFPAGVATAGLPVAFKTIANPGVTLATPNTDASGQVTFQPNLSPGPITWEATDLAPDPDVTRKGSSRTAGSGGAYSEYEVPYVLRSLGAGVVRQYGAGLPVTYVTGGLNLDIGTGAALSGQGLPAVVYAAMVAPVSGALRDATNPKACYLVLEWTGLGQAEEGKCIANVVCGAAAASPALPASLTQTEALWQEALASFQLPAGSGTGLTSIVDKRRFIGGYPQLGAVAKRVSATAQNVSSTPTDVVFDAGSAALTLAPGITYDLVAQASLLLKAPASQTISLALLLDNTLSSYTDSTISTDFVSVSAATNKAGVVGTGAAITNALRLKVSGGTGQHLTGYLLITATPRR
jgi:hypothetical protein